MAIYSYTLGWKREGIRCHKESYIIFKDLNYILRELKNLRNCDWTMEMSHQTELPHIQIL
jgi:hypothetical protein